MSTPTITDADDFDAAIEEVLASAVQNGVDPRGSWEYRSSGEKQDFEVVVYELG